MRAAETHTTTATNGHTDDTARTDELTGVWNRAGFIAAATPIVASCQRRNSSATLAYFDIGLDPDHAARSVTAPDTDAIARALMTCANELRRLYRASDVIGRVGPQRLALLLTDQTDLPMPSIEGVQTVTSATADAHALTLTVGTAQSFPGATLEDLMDKAHQRTKQIGTSNDTTTRDEARVGVPAKPSRFRAKKHR